MQRPFVPRKGMTAEQAKASVLAPETWQHLERLARRRFPNDTNLADESVLYLLAELERNDWERVRQYEERSSFLSFVSVICSRLLADFTRRRFGHIRMPKRIAELAKSDPLWETAYDLLIKNAWSRAEARAQLQTVAPERKPSSIDSMISELLASGASVPRFNESTVALDDNERSAETDTNAEHAGAVEILHGLAATILGDETGLSVAQDAAASMPTSMQSRVVQQIQRLALPSEDAMLIRLRFVEGLTVKQAAARLNLKGDPFRRLNRALQQLRTALETFEGATEGEAS